jgi:hypothetical protein
VRREAPGMPRDRPAPGTGVAGPSTRPVRAGRQEALF